MVVTVTADAGRGQHLKPRSIAHNRFRTRQAIVPRLTWRMLQSCATPSSLGFCQPGNVTAYIACTDGREAQGKIYMPGHSGLMAKGCTSETAFLLVVLELGSVNRELVRSRMNTVPAARGSKISNLNLSTSPVVVPECTKWSSIWGSV